MPSTGIDEAAVAPMLPAVVAGDGEVSDPPAPLVELPEDGLDAGTTVATGLAPGLLALMESEAALLDAPFRGRVENVNITFYDCRGQGFCGAMYNGKRVHSGAAACSWNLALGTRFRIDGDPTRRVYVCEDRGLLADTWVDIYFFLPSDGYRWQGEVGRYGTIEILD
jgi:hypothetical protein